MRDKIDYISYEKYYVLYTRWNLSRKFKEINYFIALIFKLDTLIDAISVFFFKFNIINVINVFEDE
jgi:hypothetical protein